MKKEDIICLTAENKSIKSKCECPFGSIFNDNNYHWLSLIMTDSPHLDTRASLCRTLRARNSAVCKLSCRKKKVIYILILIICAYKVSLQKINAFENWWSGLLHKLFNTDRTNLSTLTATPLYQTSHQVNDSACFL